MDGDRVRFRVSVRVRYSLHCTDLSVKVSQLSKERKKDLWGVIHYSADIPAPVVMSFTPPAT